MRWQAAPALVAVIAGAGCALVPAAPGGPLQRGGTWQLGGGAIVDVARSRTVTTPETRERTHLDAGTAAVRLGFRHAPTDYVDFAADIGLNGAGAEIRAGLPEEGRPLPVALSLAARTGAFIPLTLQQEVREQRETRIRLELYPLLWAVKGLGRLRGVVAAGVSRGVHFHAAPLIDVLQSEDRVESAIGLEWRRDEASISLTALLYYVARSWGARSVPCGIAHFTAFGSRDFVSYHHRCGGAVVLTVGFTFGGRAPPTVPDPREGRY